jgi:elongation factor 1-alpha
MFFNIVGKKPIQENENTDSVEYFVDNIFQVKGVGIVLGGHLLSGTIKVSDNLLIGPLDDGKYESVMVKSLHSKKVNVQSVSYGGYVCVALKKIDKKILRKGIVLISPKSEQISISTFYAKINVMRSHSTTIKVGYEPLLCINSIRQTVQILEIKEKKNARNLDNIEDDNILRTNDSAIAKLKFKYRPEYLKSGTRFIMCEGNLKIVGEIM